MIKILRTIDTSPLIDCFNSIDAEIQWSDFGHKGKQAGLQHKPGENPWTSAVGRSSGHELESTELNPFFSGTVFEELINEFGFYKTRLMWVGPFACYSMHKDETPRVHIPLITNLDCYFVFKYTGLKHLAPGFVHWVDTRLPHTFMNCSDKWRLHLIGAVKPE